MDKQEQEELFMRDFHACSIDLARMYGTAYTTMEIEMGSAMARRLAPVVLPTLVESAERFALAQQRQRHEDWLAEQRLRCLEGPPSADGGSGDPPGLGPERRQMTIEEVLTRKEEPW